MTKPFRENKYLNESGSKKGTWYMNRLDYFKFHEYPGYKKHKVIAILVWLISIYLISRILPISFLASLPFVYCCYASLVSFNILHNKVCRYRGYFLYPKKFLKFFMSRKVEIDLNDFDSIATMSKK